MRAIDVAREARAVRVRGVVQGVGFRPFVARLAAAHALTGWVLNDADGVRIHVEGTRAALARFLAALEAQAPPAAIVATIDACDVPVEAHTTFVIRDSAARGAATVPIGVDLAVCDDCVRELRDPGDRRFGYPYINCTNCGPRYSVITALPYDRPNTTMRDWALCDACRREYDDPRDRRYHAQPIACGACGPHLRLEGDPAEVRDDAGVIARTAALLRAGAVVAIKGIGGYHLACDARNDAAVAALRERKFRKDKPFALMVRDEHEASALAECGPRERALLTGVARPIVLLPARHAWPRVAPDQSRIGVMLAYSPLHVLLFDAGAPPALVMTSGNRSNEPIAFTDADVRERLAGIADALLIGERPIARRSDDSVVAGGPVGPAILRRARGFAPAAVVALPSSRPILALGADLKNTVTLVVAGQAIVGPHIGDLDQLDSFTAFAAAVDDLLAMYALSTGDVTVVHDSHPHYRSTRYAERFGGERIAVQHHHAHIASVLAESGWTDRSVLGLALDGTGYGTDGTIWGCEFLVGSLRSGFERIAHLAPYALPGGDTAARFPAVCAVGLAECCAPVDLAAEPFGFPADVLLGRALLERRLHTHMTTSAGRLFDGVAALCGFVERTTFEGQAAMWLEHRASRSNGERGYPFGFDGQVLDFREMLAAAIADRRAGIDVGSIARAFHLGFARALASAADELARARGISTVVLSGGVWQNELLFERVARDLTARGFTLGTNRSVPVNDGGISLGQAAIAALGSS